MITQDKIDRINELAHKAKAEGLTEEEVAERDVLRREYIDAFKENLRAQLENIKIVDQAQTDDDKLDEVIEETIDEAIEDVEDLIIN